jgi:hypothetical protein
VHRHRPISHKLEVHKERWPVLQINSHTKRKESLLTDLGCNLGNFLHMIIQKGAIEPSGTYDQGPSRMPLKISKKI